MNGAYILACMRTTLHIDDALPDKSQKFLLELGYGFYFELRQMRIGFYILEYEQLGCLLALWLDAVPVVFALENDAVADFEDGLHFRVLL